VNAPSWLAGAHKGAALGHVRSQDRDALTALLARAEAAGTQDAVLAYIKAEEPALAFITTPAAVGRWGAAPWQAEMIHSLHRRQLGRGGNKTGKTATASCKCALVMDDEDACFERPANGTVRILYVVADMSNAYADDVCLSLREFLPPSKWHPDTKYSRLKGFTVSGRRAYKHHNGDEIIFRSGTQDGQALAGIMADLVIVNEPPVESRWGEIMRAAAFAQAPVLVLFTPIDDHGVSRDVVWLKYIIEGKPGEPLPLGADGSPLWLQHIVHLTTANAPHRSPESIAQQIADMPAHERNQRQYADWEGPAPARTLASFGPGNVFDFLPGRWDMLPDYNKEHDLYLRISFDHGELEKKEVCGLIAYQTAEGARAWALDEYVSDGATSFLTDAQGVLAMLERHGLSLGAIDEAFGDTNSAGKSHLKKMNQVFEAEFKTLTGITLRIQNAMKGPGSVGMGTINLNNAFATNRLWVSTLAARLRRSCDRWDGRPKDENKDAVDMFRYGVNDLFETERGNVRRIRRG